MDENVKIRDSIFVDLFTLGYLALIICGSLQCSIFDNVQNI